jgi:hypothetical protein
MLIIFRHDLNVTVNGFGLRNGSDFLHIREIITFITLLIIFLREFGLMLFVRGHFTVLLQDGLLIDVLLSELVAGLGFSVLTVHGFKCFRLEFMDSIGCL